MKVTAARVIIVLLGAIGDVIRAMPLAMRVRKGYPGAHIAWAVEPASANLLAGHPAIDKVLLFERSRGARALVELLRLVRSEGFDLSLDLQRHAKSGLISWASGAPVRLGFDRGNSRELNWLFNTHSVGSMPHLSSKLEQYLRFADYLELPGGAIDFGLVLTSDERSRVRELLAGAGDSVACLFLGSTWPSRLWPTEFWVALASALIGRGLRVVMVGGRAECGMAEAIAASLGGEVINLVDRTSLRETFGVFSSACVAIGPDSGPMHLAAAAGSRVVSLWGATSPARSAPWDNEDLVVVGRVPCAPCYLRVCPVGGLCMRAITPERVMQVVDRALEGSR